MEKAPKYCECQGPNYQGCMPIPNGLYACYTKSGEIDEEKGCLGEKKKGIDGVVGWSKGCKSLTYSDLKDRMTKWCNKLFQEGVYDSEQYQSCLKNLEIGTVESTGYYDNTEDLDDGKEMKHIYGYYQRGRDKINPMDPSKKIVKDDFQKMLIQHANSHLFLIANGQGDLSLSANPDKFDERDWQIVDLGQSQHYALRSYYGRYLIGNDTGTTNANRDQLSPWAQWKLEKHNHQYSFFSVVHEKYLTIYNDQPVLRDGWNDSNLWNISEKSKTSGGFLGNFDNSSLTLQKDNMLGDLGTYNTNRVEYQTKSLILKNKRNYLNLLRDNQRKFMLQMSDKAGNKLEENKKITGDKINALKKSLETQLKEHDEKVEKDNSSKTINPFESQSSRLNREAKLEKFNKLKRQEILSAHNIDIDLYEKNIVNLDSRIEDLENYKIEITDNFTVIKEKENEELGKLIAENTSISNQWQTKAKEQTSLIIKWIKELSKENKILESQIDSLRSEISIQLEDINSIAINIENGKTENTEFQARAIVNDEIRIGQLADLKYQFYIGIMLILLTSFLTGYISYLTLIRIKT